MAPSLHIICCKMKLEDDAMVAPACACISLDVTYITLSSYITRFLLISHFVHISLVFYLYHSMFIYHSMLLYHSMSRSRVYHSVSCLLQWVVSPLVSHVITRCRARVYITLCHVSYSESCLLSWVMSSLDVARACTSLCVTTNIWYARWSLVGTHA